MSLVNSRRELPFTEMVKTVEEGFGLGGISGVSLGFIQFKTSNRDTRQGSTLEFRLLILELSILDQI